ncbi:MAG: nucleotidyltransferase family protein [Chromatiaceae bacterium]|nr:nucleotidyltransferase family protein [Gammaproteobacteria bacterium]MCP5303906.1 nucleotidyltransferase family protein [Chromatiaceae bacterium]MCP5313633.1 nucleotidyltransferase family protein [Chromatiaceae bacterium]
MKTIVGVLLAAGSAQRFGTAKLLHPLPDGEPIGVAAARSLLSALPHCVAVVRPGDVLLHRELTRLGVRLVENPAPEGGLGSSLAVGVEASADADGWLIALGDMPFIRVATIAALAGAVRDGASIVAPEVGGRRGHPVGFAGHWGPALRALRGDRGARDLIEAHPGALQLHTTDDRGVLHDIDSPDDLQASP